MNPGSATYQLMGKSSIGSRWGARNGKDLGWGTKGRRLEIREFQAGGWQRGQEGLDDKEWGGNAVPRNCLKWPLAWAAGGYGVGPPRVAQSVSIRRLVSVQATISQFVSSSPASGSALTV